MGLCATQDFFVLYGYFSAGIPITLVFGCCQIAILLAGSLYQFWGTSFRQVFVATCESWNVGMPCNRLQKVLMREKVFEAPLSLFLQFLEISLLLFKFRFFFWVGPCMPIFQKSWLSFALIFFGTKIWGFFLPFIWKEAYFHCLSRCFRASLASPMASTSPDT